MSATEQDRDDFWDLDKLVPKKKTIISPFATQRQVTEHTVEGEDTGNKEERKLTFTSTPSASRTEESSYVPERSGLIKRVTIKRYVDKYDFYGNFRKAALIYYDYKMPKCEFISFYSYMPQYSQLNSQQKNYYFFWRDEVRRGKYIKCDYSYLYLYVYEILNLPDKISPEEGIKLLCRLWREYRGELPRIDAYFSIWVQDYCFVYNLPCPLSEIRNFIFDVIGGTDFKEFYLSDITGAESDGTEAMLVYLSDYDWHSTRYAAGENEQIFRNHMLGAMRLVINELCGGVSPVSTTEKGLLKRDAFPHSLCTHAVKCKLEIEYIPLSKDESLRKTVTAAVRYTENKLRALLGVKSRLGIKDMSDAARRIIDRYFDNIFEIERRRRERECAPEYEKLYDAEDKVLSFADADEIERASWTTTARLIVDEESEQPEPKSVATRDKEQPDFKSATEPNEEQPNFKSATEPNEEHPDFKSAAEPNEEQPDFKSAAEPNEEQLNSLGALYEEDTESESEWSAPLTEKAAQADTYGLCAEDVELIRGLANGEDVNVGDDAYERINEAFLSSDLGDIILENDGDRYVLISDYLEDVNAWLESL